MTGNTIRHCIALLINLGAGVALLWAIAVRADPPQGLPFPFAMPFTIPSAPVKPPPLARPPWPWAPAPRRSAAAYRFPWAAPANRPTATVPLFAAPGLPFTGSRHAGVGIAGNPFAANPFNNPFAGGSAMGMLSAPMLQGATSIVAPMAMNYAIASMNPTTFNNFLRLMMQPQPMGANFGAPFWGPGVYPATRPFGSGYPQPVAPNNNPFLSLFAPRPRR